MRGAGQRSRWRLQQWDCRRPRLLPDRQQCPVL